MLPEGLAFVVLDAPELVSMDEGTGIVHTAAAYGVADLELCQRMGVAVRHVVGLDGRFLDGQTRYRGMFVKDADPKIIEDLREQGSLYRAERILHTYPFCWRCDTPLLYYAVTSWFIRTTAVKDRLLAQQPQRALAAGAHPRWADGQLAREPHRLEPVAEPVLGHAAADLGLRGVRREVLRGQRGRRRADGRRRSPPAVHRRGHACRARRATA